MPSATYKRFNHPQMCKTTCEADRGEGAVFCFLLERAETRMLALAPLSEASVSP